MNSRVGIVWHQKWVLQRRICLAYYRVVDSILIANMDTQLHYIIYKEVSIRASISASWL